MTEAGSLLDAEVLALLPDVVRECMTSPRWWQDELVGVQVMKALSDLSLPDRMKGYRSLDCADSVQWSWKGHALVHQSSAGAEVAHMSYVGHSVLGRRVRLDAFFCVAVRNLRRGTVHMMSDGVLVDTGEKTIGCVIADGTQTGVRATVMPGRRIVETEIVPANALVTKNC